MTSRTKHIGRYTLILIILFFNFLVCAQTKKVESQIYLSPENDYLQDSSKEHKLKGNNKEYLFLRLRNSKSSIVRNFSNIFLVSGDPSLKVNDTQEKLLLSKEYYDEYKECTIDSIIIVGRNIFYKEDSMSTHSWIERTVDKIHLQTKEKVIRRYLLFREGDKIDPYTLATNEYLLRDLPFFASSFFIIKPSVDPLKVNIYVFTQDSWTIGVTGALGEKPYLTLYDENFLGTGDKLSVSYLHKTEHQNYGAKFEFLKRNIKGKFIDADLTAALGNNNVTGYGSLTKKYKLPGDHFWNIQGGYQEYGEQQLTEDTTLFLARKSLSGYLGKSFLISKKDPSLALYSYLYGKHTVYENAPYRSTYYNPYYHDVNLVTLTTAIARQNYFQGNMIYGYGNIEDIPYGFKVEATAGWGYSPQTEHFWYLMGQIRYSFFSNKTGFFDFTLQGSTDYLIENNDWTKGAFVFNMKHFSPLYRLGKGFFLRNFLHISHTQGLNRALGEREVLAYTRDNGIRGLRAPYEMYGSVRTVANFESVIFTPYYFLHFRFAGFVWGDIGWLGDNSLFWKNKFSSAVGVGVRIKNERLIIDNIEIRLGIALSKYKEKGYSYFGISNEARFKIQPIIGNSHEPYYFE